MKPRISILMSLEMTQNIISKEDYTRLKEFSNLNPEIPQKINEESTKKVIKGAEGCISGWGTPRLTKEILDEAPNLKIIAHSAGSIKGIVSEEVWRRKITVTSAASALGIGVAEFTLGIMLTTMKRVWWFNELTHKGFWREDKEVKRVKEPYKLVVGVIGAGNVGRNFIRLLKSLEVKILLYDPYCSEEETKKLGVKKVSLEDLMKVSDVVSLHAPNISSNYHMINRDNLKLLKDGAIFINTARGSLVDEEALIEELKKGRITACLDVTDPEPPGKDSFLRRLPNVILTPHIAGAVANNRFRQGNYAVNEIIRFFSGEKVRYEVTENMLNRIA
ncbi:hydroxyacid dehydrogenase [Candidatus Aerophobetes bacterium]|nr:hydroxyacid dehydrogenase [Candidatus Aerophobetes bacterium]